MDRSSKDLIEGSSVPDLERLAMQEMLNAMTMVGELSGPPLKEDGKDSALYQERLREREARMTIMGAEIPAERPDDPLAFAGARGDDEGVLAMVRVELTFIPESDYQGFHPREACLKRIAKLEELVKAKWQGAMAVGRIRQLLMSPPGNLVQPDQRFDYAGVETHLNNLSEAEDTFDTLPQADPERKAIAELIDRYREAVVAGMGGRAVGGVTIVAAGAPASGGRPGSAPLPPIPPPPAPVVMPEPRLPSSRNTTPLAVHDPEEEAFQAWRSEAERLPHEGKAALLAELEPTEGLDGRKVGYLASALALAKPSTLTPELADRMDAAGLKELESRTGQLPLSELQPRLRMAVVKQLAGRAGAHAEARGGFAGAIAAQLVRQHPRALPEILANTPGENKVPVVVGLARHLADDEIVALGRESVHALYKAIGAPANDEARRQVARLLRLSAKK